MAKIASIKSVFLLFLALIPTLTGFSQAADKPNKKKVEISADIMSSGGDFQRLLGNVSFHHNKMVMTSDSAHYFESADLLRAYSRVHIQRGDTINIYGEKLVYDSALEKAEMSDNVILIDNESTLYTDHIFYDMTDEIAYYETGGRIINEDNVLTSVIGRYYSETEVFHFKDSVKLVNPEYTMYADTLNYDTVTETAYFLGPSEVIGDSIYVRCNFGWYDTKNEKSLLLDSAKVDNKKQIILGDSIYYENGTGYGTAFYNVTISDLTNDIIVKGNNSWYYRDPERFMITDSAQFIQYRGGDFLFMHADTLWSVTNTYLAKKSDFLEELENDKPFADSLVIAEPDSLSQDTIVNYRLLRAYKGVRVFSDDMQAKCDSLSYSFRDSVIRLYYEPVLWSDENQLTADSMLLITENEAISELRLYNNSFVIEEVDSTRYQQIKGKNLIGYFRDNSIHKIEVTGNGENIYFALEEGELVGVNQATCASMDIYLEDGKIQEIYFLKNPDGSLDPPLHIAPTERQLDNFRWLHFLRPLNRLDIFRKSGAPPKTLSEKEERLKEEFQEHL